MTSSKMDGWITSTDPPLDVPGMARIVFDHRGRLLELAVVPPLKAAPGSAEPQWDELFALAELPANFRQPRH